jgi:putative sigma-54 modulation protein
MRIDIQSKNFELSDRLSSFVEKKVNKLETFYDQIIDALVYLNEETSTSKEVVIQLNVKDNTLLCREKGESFEQAADNAVESMKRQIKKYKEKQRGQ